MDGGGRSTSPASEDDLMTSSFVSMESEKELELDPPKTAAGGAWHQDVLGLDDLVAIDPARARVLQHLRQLATRRQHILQDVQLSDEARRRQLANLTVSRGRWTGRGRFWPT